jgi:hypothetical protein
MSASTRRCGTNLLAWTAGAFTAQAVCLVAGAVVASVFMPQPVPVVVLGALFFGLYICIGLNACGLIGYLATALFRQSGQGTPCLAAAGAVCGSLMLAVAVGSGRLIHSTSDHVAKEVIVLSSVSLGACSQAIAKVIANRVRQNAR